MEIGMDDQDESVSRSLSSCLKTSPVPKVRSNMGRRPKHHLSLQQIEEAIQYILNHIGKKRQISPYMHYSLHEHVTEANAMALPGRFPGTRVLRSSFSPVAPPNTSLVLSHSQVFSRKAGGPGS